MFQETNQNIFFWSAHCTRVNHTRNTQFTWHWPLTQFASSLSNDQTIKHQLTRAKNAHIRPPNSSTRTNLKKVDFFIFRFCGHGVLACSLEALTMPFGRERRVLDLACWHVDVLNHSSLTSSAAQPTCCGAVLTCGQTVENDTSDERDSPRDVERDISNVRMMANMAEIYVVETLDWVIDYLPDARLSKCTNWKFQICAQWLRWII